MFSGALSNAIANPTDLLKVKSKLEMNESKSMEFSLRFECKPIIRVFKANDYFQRCFRLQEKKESVVYGV